MSRDVTGAPLTPGVNVDPVDVREGLEFAASLGYAGNPEDRMVVEYVLTRHARGEEEGGQKSWLSHFGHEHLTGYYAVIARAVSFGTRKMRAEEIADEVSSGRTVGGHSGIHPSTRKIARAVALEAARLGLGLSAREPFVPPPPSQGQ